MDETNSIIAENKRREKQFAMRYNPLTGEGCYGRRFAINRGGKRIHLPIELKAKSKQMSDDELNIARLRCDFEYWAAKCARVQDKRSGNYVPLLLNQAQRIIYAECADMLQKQEPIRIIVLKARQIGSSTFICAFALWLMLCRNTSWNTGICGHNKDVAINFIETMQGILEHYPTEMKTKSFPMLKQIKGSQNQFILKERNSKIITSSSISPDSLRSNNLKIALMSEVAFWSGTSSDIVRSVCGSIDNIAETFVVYESTPNGSGGFFYHECKRAIEGLSDKRFVFVPWWKLPCYREELKDPATFFFTLNKYEKWLWQLGCSLQQIAWYRTKSKEYQKPQQMIAEFPSTYDEAFKFSGHSAFTVETIDKCASNVKEPTLIEFNSFTLSTYCTDVDFAYVICNIGGLDADAQMFSINVFGASKNSEKMIVCAEWAGLCDYDDMINFIVNVCDLFGTKHVCFCCFKGNGGDGEAGLDHCFSLAKKAMLVVPNFCKKWKTNQRIRTQAILCLNEALKKGLIVEHSQNAIAQYKAFMKDLNGYSTIADDKGEYLITNRACGWLVFETIVVHEKIIKNLMLEKHFLY